MTLNLALKDWRTHLLQTLSAQPAFIDGILGQLMEPRVLLICWLYFRQGGSMPLERSAAAAPGADNSESKALPPSVFVA